jgi:hypothetical protein
MNSFITDRNFYKVGMTLDTRRHGAMIYENIQMLASNLGHASDLITPKRDVSSHPACKLWKGWERSHACYINSLLRAWYDKGYKSDINRKNMEFLQGTIEYTHSGSPMSTFPDWITDELIMTHRSVLIQKKPEYYKPLWPDVPDDLKMRYDWRKGEVKS